MSSLFAQRPQSVRDAIVTFKAGKMIKYGNLVKALPAKGQLSLVKGQDQLYHLQWRDRKTNALAQNDDMIIFPGDARYYRVDKCKDGRVYVLDFGQRQVFYWMQEPKTDKDDEYEEKMDAIIDPSSVKRRAQAKKLKKRSSSSSDDKKDKKDDKKDDDDSNNDSSSSSSKDSSNNNDKSSDSSNNNNNNNNNSNSDSSASTTQNNSDSTSSSSSSGGTNDATANNLHSMDDIAQLLAIMSQQEQQRLIKKPALLLQDALPSRALKALFMKDPKKYAALLQYLPTLSGGSSGDIKELLATPQSNQFKSTVRIFNQALRSGQLGGLCAEIGLDSSVGASGDVSQFLNAIIKKNYIGTK